MERLPPIDLATLSRTSKAMSEKLTEAKRAASRLLGCYRTGDANDPETYIAAVVSILNRYPLEVIAEVTEPATGLPGKLKWLPSIAEIREECEILAARIRRKIEREEQIREQFRLRDERERPRIAETRKLQIAGPGT